MTMNNLQGEPTHPQWSLPDFILVEYHNGKVALRLRRLVLRLSVSPILNSSLLILN